MKRPTMSGTSLAASGVASAASPAFPETSSAYSSRSRYISAGSSIVSLTGRLSGMVLIRSFVMALLLHANARVSKPDRD